VHEKMIKDNTETLRKGSRGGREALIQKLLD
jgi:hypothetical protein